jgi:hypothetical protein
MIISNIPIKKSEQFDADYSSCCQTICCFLFHKYRSSSIYAGNNNNRIHIYQSWWLFYCKKWYIRDNWWVWKIASANDRAHVSEIIEEERMTTKAKSWSIVFLRKIMKDGGNVTLRYGIIITRGRGRRDSKSCIDGIMKWWYVWMRNMNILGNHGAASYGWTMSTDVCYRRTLCCPITDTFYSATDMRLFVNAVSICTIN